ncbi:hypothetical protein VNO77_02460 [Canavalia gladiata]|uniref:Uncharacterized protein n=1 Tax=Canavalia gladiata TaxID=3824 RepID=A0AAN9MTU3_CANGL
MQNHIMILFLVLASHHSSSEPLQKLTSSIEMKRNSTNKNFPKAGVHIQLGMVLLQSNGSKTYSLSPLFPFINFLHTNNHPIMEKPPRCKFTLIFFIIISLSLGLISFVLCIAAEIKRNKEEDIRWSGKLCYLPSSKAFGLGIAALVSFFFAHIIGNSMLLKYSCSRSKSKSQSKMPAIAKVLLLISWVSFAIAAILLIAATSMNRRQPYRVGWLNGECYLVKEGTYAGSAILVLVTVGSLNGSAFSTIKSSQANQDKKIHKQMG